MGSFSLGFPDDDLLAILGDELKLIHSGGGSEIILGEFDFKALDEELGDRFDVVYPVFDCNIADAEKVEKGSRLQFNGKTYKLFKKMPIDTGKTRIVMKTL